MNKKSIQISDGSILELEYTDEFYAKVRSHFGLHDGEELDDDHLKVFFCDTFKSTLDNLDKEA